MIVGRFDCLTRCVGSMFELPECANRKSAVFSSILEAFVANPPHVMNISCDFVAFCGFAVTFNDDFAFARLCNLMRHLSVPRGFTF